MPFCFILSIDNVLRNRLRNVRQLIFLVFILNLIFFNFIFFFLIIFILNFNFLLLYFFAFTFNVHIIFDILGFIINVLVFVYLFLLHVILFFTFAKSFWCMICWYLILLSNCCFHLVFLNSKIRYFNGFMSWYESLSLCIESIFIEKTNVKFYSNRHL